MDKCLQTIYQDCGNTWARVDKGRYNILYIVFSYLTVKDWGGEGMMPQPVFASSTVLVCHGQQIRMIYGDVRFQYSGKRFYLRHYNFKRWSKANIILSTVFLHFCGAEQNLKWQWIQLSVFHMDTFLVSWSVTY